MDRETWQWRTIWERLIRPFSRGAKSAGKKPENSQPAGCRALPASYASCFDSSAFLPEDWLDEDESMRLEVQRMLRTATDSKQIAIALTGPDGRGLSCLLEACMADARADGWQVVTVRSVARLRSGEQLSVFIEEALSSQTLHTGHTLLVLPALHELVLRAKGATGLLQTLQAILGLSSDRYSWLVACREPSWTRFKLWVDLPRVFTEVAEYPGPDVERITQRLLFHHQRSGWALRLVDKGGKIHKEGGKGFDEALAQWTKAACAQGGSDLDSVAQLWLSCAGYREEADTVELHLPPDPALPVLVELPIIERYALSEIFMHGRLTEDELAEVFRISLTKARTLLARLAASDYIQKDTTGRGWCIRTRIAAIVRRQLSEAHLAD